MKKVVLLALICFACVVKSQVYIYKVDKASVFTGVGGKYETKTAISGTIILNLSENKVSIKIEGADPEEYQITHSSMIDIKDRKPALKVIVNNSTWDYFLFYDASDSTIRAIPTKINEDPCCDFHISTMHTSTY